MNILYIADPNSIHDIKWITYFSKENKVRAFLLSRETHYLEYIKSGVKDNMVNLGYLKDFSIIRFYNNFLMAYKIRRLINKHAISLIHIHYAEPNALWCLFRKYFGVPMIITCRGTDVLKTIPNAFKSKSLLNYFVSTAYKKAFQRADWVTCTSRQQLQSIKDFSNRNSQISIIRTGVDIQNFMSDTSDHFPLVNNGLYILFPRKMRPIYNHEFCLEAIALLPENLKAKYKMVFVGKGYGDVLYERKIKDNMNAITGVTFDLIENQSQESLAELYKRASLVVMTPKSDGSPVSAMEALICGKQLILGPLKYDEDIFSQNVIKLIEWSPEELAEKMSKALVNKQNTDVLPDTILTQIDWSYNMDKLNSIYLDFEDYK